MKLLKSNKYNNERLDLHTLQKTVADQIDDNVYL